MDSSSRWLDLRHQEALLHKASAPPWVDDGCFHGSSTKSVEWIPAEGLSCRSSGSDGSAAAKADDHTPCWVKHEVAWCQRAEGDVAIHRFKLAAGALKEDVLDSLKTIVREDMKASRKCDQASNVNGFHGNRDLWLRYEFHQTCLPQLIGEAVSRTSRLESVELGQTPVASCCDESWFNVTGPDGWNQQHTHAGSKFACVFFIADGGCCTNTDQLGGRLVFVPNKPDRLPDYHLEQVRRPLNHAGKRRKLVSSPAPQYLLLNPEPGTAVVFPGFLPHFVLPMLGIERTKHDSSVHRISCAFNFGERDPVLVHMFVQPGPQGEPYVKVFLEVEEDVYGM